MVGPIFVSAVVSPDAGPSMNMLGKFQFFCVPCLNRMVLEGRGTNASLECLHSFQDSLFYL